MLRAHVFWRKSLMRRAIGAVAGSIRGEELLHTMRRAWPFMIAGVYWLQSMPAAFPQAPNADLPIPKKILPEAPTPKAASADLAQAPPTILQPGEFPIDLGSALRLAGAENPELLLARQRIGEATALRQLAVAQLLPNLNVGTNYDLHRGALQQSTGNI